MNPIMVSSWLSRVATSNFVVMWSGPVADGEEQRESRRRPRRVYARGHCRTQSMRPLPPISRHKVGYQQTRPLRAYQRPPAGLATVPRLALYSEGWPKACNHRRAVAREARCFGEQRSSAGPVTATFRARARRSTLAEAPAATGRVVRAFEQLHGAALPGRERCRA